MSKELIHLSKGTQQTACKKALDTKLHDLVIGRDALLIQVPQVPMDLLDQEVAANRGYFAYPPHGLLYISATLKSKGIHTEVLDLNFLILKAAKEGTTDYKGVWQAAINEKLATLTDPFIGLSFMFDPTLPQLMEISAYIRNANPTACIAIGGVAASSDPLPLLEDQCADFIFTHEGEAGIESFFSYLNQEREALPLNLIFLDKDRKSFKTPQKSGGPVEIDIEEEYKKIPISDYHKVGSLSNFSRMNGVDIPFSPVLSRRGCRGRCSFCSVRNFNGAGIRTREGSSVVHEMKHLYEQYGIRHFDWLDDDLLYNEKKAVALFEEIAQILPDITWAANNGLIASFISDRLLTVMEKSGCIGYKVGLESGNAQVLKQVHKPTSLKKYFEFVKRAQDYPNMFVAVNFIMGFPGETVAQMRDSYQVARRSNLDWYNFYIYQPLKNTEMYIAYGGMQGDKERLIHGKDCMGPLEGKTGKDGGFNPVRAGAFRQYEQGSDILTGYDVAQLDGGCSPSRDQLKEIWFTYNYVANFLRMKALYTESDKALQNGMQWLRVLAGAYPDNAAMSSVLYFLSRRAGLPRMVQAQFRDEAHRRFKDSDYWRMRDTVFSFSSFLDNAIPPIDPYFEISEDEDHQPLAQAS